MSKTRVTEAEVRTAALNALLDVAPDIDSAELDPARAFRDQFDFDSMDYLNFVTALHHNLGCDIPEVDYPRLASLDGCVQYLLAQLNRTGSE
jgi:acyl carrier protein